jgi:hypothetical protein
VGFAPTFFIGNKGMDKGLITEYIGRVAGQVAKNAGIELVHVEVAGTKGMRWFASLLTKRAA